MIVVVGMFAVVVVRVALSAHGLALSRALPGKASPAQV
jgi:hypothetical protein